MLRAQGVKPIPWWVLLSLLVVAVLLIGFSAGAAEQVSIETLLSWNAPSFHRQEVTLEGVVSAVIVLPPAVTMRCRVLYGRAAFMLDDETGILPVEVLGTCNPNAYDGLPQDGDRVRVTGMVEVMRSHLPRQVRIQAMTLQIINPSHSLNLPPGSPSRQSRSRSD